MESHYPNGLLRPHGARVNAVAPGNVVFTGETWKRKLAERREFFEQYIRSEVPLQRFGRPEETADAVVLPASQRASFITGGCFGMTPSGAAQGIVHPRRGA